MPDIYLALYFPENPSGFTKYMQGSIRPSRNENSLANDVLCNTWKQPRTGYDYLIQINMRQAEHYPSSH